MPNELFVIKEQHNFAQQHIQTVAASSHLVNDGVTCSLSDVHQERKLHCAKKLYSGQKDCSERYIPNYRTSNLLFAGDNKDFLQRLLSEEGQTYIAENGGLKLIYIDPPFNVGSAFTITLPLAFGKKAPGVLEQIAYNDKWEGHTYTQMVHERLVLMHKLLADDGVLFLHCDWRTSALIRLMLDSIFGVERFLGEIIWHYTGGGRSTRYFSRKHDTIFYYAKSNKWTFNVDAVRVPYKPTSGYAKNGIVSKAGKQYSPNPLGTPPDDVWDMPIVNPMARERLAYPTQKPEALLERILLACSNKGDLVADFFCGSGTTVAVAQRLGRKWITSDQSLLSLATTERRLHSLAQTAGFFTAHGYNSYTLVTAPIKKEEKVQKKETLSGYQELDFAQLVTGKKNSFSLQGAKVCVHFLRKNPCKDNEKERVQSLSKEQYARKDTSSEIHITFVDYTPKIPQNIESSLQKQVDTLTQETPSGLSWVLGWGVAFDVVPENENIFLTKHFQKKAKSAERAMGMQDSGVFLPSKQVWRTTPDDTLATDIFLHVPCVTKDYLLTLQIVDIFGERHKNYLVLRATSCHTNKK